MKSSLIAPGLQSRACFARPVNTSQNDGTEDEPYVFEVEKRHHRPQVEVITVEFDLRRGEGWREFPGWDQRMTARDQTIHLPKHMTPRNTTEKHHGGDDIESFTQKIVIKYAQIKRPHASTCSAIGEFSSIQAHFCPSPLSRSPSLSTPLAAAASSPSAAPSPPKARAADFSSPGNLPRLVHLLFFFLC